MTRTALSVALAALLSAALASPALAFQCPKLIGQIRAEAGRRLDDAATKAKAKADEAEKLHKAGRHAESVKVANEGLALLGIMAK